MAIRIGLLAFRVGEATALPLPRPFEVFYRTVAGLVTGEQVSELDPPSQPLTIPIAQAIIKEDEEIFQRARAGLERVSESAAGLIIDLAHPPRSDLPFFSIMQSIKTALQQHWWGRKDFRKVFLLLPGVLSQKGDAFLAVSKEIEAGQLALLMGDGAVAGKLSPNFDAKKYRRALQEVREDPLTLLERKMIRRIGHFTYPGAGEALYSTKFFYDGSACASEIVKLLEDPMRQRKIEQIAFHAPMSPWLTDAALALAARLRCDALDLQAMQAAAELEAVRDRLAVLTPMVDSGRTLGQIHLWLKEVQPSCSPYYLAVLSTEGFQERAGNRKIAIEDGKLEVHYLLRVAQTPFNRGEEPACTSEHSGSGFDLAEEPLKLTSYAFWQMVSEHGLKEEEDVPEGWRFGLGHVPRFPEILESNGPWLAHKLDRLLRETRLGLPTDPLVVCPDEKGAIRLTDCVASMFKYNIVRVPRAVINEIRADAAGSWHVDPQTLYDEWRQKFGETFWFTQLESVRNNADVRIITMDEFVFSGGTMKRLRQLCHAFGLEAECCVIPGLR